MKRAPTISALDGVLARAADPEDFERWVRQGRSARWCTHPVRLTGSTTSVDQGTGEILKRYSTAAEPDGALLKGCGQRRATTCPQCAEVYRADAWHLIVAGLQGGKGVPSSVARHPMVFATFTAPSFGAVHSRRERGGRARPCRMGGGRCPHGLSHRCTTVHDPDDERLGEPLCPDCYDYEGVILWNAMATELWRRTTIGVTRVLAAEAGMTPSAWSRIARLSYVKVVEYQRRGVVHFHVVARLDGPDAGSAPPSLLRGVLERAVRDAAAATAVSYPAVAGRAHPAVWGEQIDVRPIAVDGITAGSVAAYIAKYATKSTDAFGRLDHKLKPADLADLAVPPHLARLVATAWGLGGRPELADLRLREWAHTLGFRGHWLTKSRGYSTTFGALRAARTSWTRRNTGAPQPSSAVVLKEWRYVGRGWANSGDAWLAETAAADLADQRRHARRARREAAQPTEA